VKTSAPAASGRLPVRWTATPVRSAGNSVGWETPPMKPA